MTTEHEQLLEAIDENNKEISDVERELRELLHKDRELHQQLLEHEAKTDNQPVGS